MEQLPFALLLLTYNQISSETFTLDVFSPQPIPICLLTWPVPERILMRWVLSSPTLLDLLATGLAPNTALPSALKEHSYLVFPFFLHLFKSPNPFLIILQIGAPSHRNSSQPHCSLIKDFRVQLQLPHRSVNFLKSWLSTLQAKPIKWLQSPLLDGTKHSHWHQLVSKWAQGPFLSVSVFLEEKVPPAIKVERDTLPGTLLFFHLYTSSKLRRLHPLDGSRMYTLPPLSLLPPWFKPLSLPFSLPATPRPLHYQTTGTISALAIRS